MFVCEKCRKVMGPREASCMIYEKEPDKPSGTRIVGQTRVCFACYSQIVSNKKG